MSESPPQVFPFGQQVLPRPPSPAETRQHFVLGAYPSGLHVRWQPPTLDGVAIRGRLWRLIVDNEPIPFWDGEDAETRFEEWRQAVGWQEEWGTVSVAARGSNGPSGKWVDEHILRPLGVTRGDACISDC